MRIQSIDWSKDYVTIHLSNCSFRDLVFSIICHLGGLHHVNKQSLPATTHLGLLLALYLTHISLHDIMILEGSSSDSKRYYLMVSSLQFLEHECCRLKAKSQCCQALYSYCHALLCISWHVYSSDVASKSCGRFIALDASAAAQLTQ